jgi:hypothetical protein
MNVKIWMFKKTYPNVRTLKKPANLPPSINGIMKLPEENMTFVIVAMNM